MRETDSLSLGGASYDQSSMVRLVTNQTAVERDESAVDSTNRIAAISAGPDREEVAEELSLLGGLDSPRRYLPGG